MTEFDYVEDQDRYAEAYEQDEPPQPEPDERILDIKGVEIKVGDSVIVDTFDGTEPAKIIDISDWDGDAVDYGQTIVIPPAVTVEFADGDTERYPTFSEGFYGPQVCEEVTVNA